MSTLDEKIAVMNHFNNGGEVEFLRQSGGTWAITRNTKWNWQEYDYRIKAPAKTKMWLWLIKNRNNYTQTTFYASTKEEVLFHDLQGPTEVIRKIDYTEIEV